MNTIRLAIFASGTGSNALRLIDHFKDHPTIKIQLVLSNRADAKVVPSAQAKGVNTLVRDNAFVGNGIAMVELMKEHRIDHIILAGYLRLIPAELISAYSNRIINVHPSLLPKYGGKGMYGHHVHDAVIKNGERESGISIHFVNEKFDEGNLIAQFHCSLTELDNEESLFKKIQYLEHNYFPVVVEKTILNPNHA
jgi:phosphoribosylglycinamide formyltransferase-1